MDAVYEWVQPLFRWAHVVAGVLWIGLLYFFNWINGNFAKSLDAETKQKVLPELLPRTLYFFRWGAAFTWITGVLLLVLVYYGHKQANMVSAENAAQGSTAMLIGIGVVLGGALIYDQLWKMMAKKEEMAVALSFALLVGLLAFMHYSANFSSRALFIHTGALFGTAMAYNVWFRIWPMQRKIIAAIKEGTKPEPAWGGMAGLRSKHNTYMSVPLIFMMLSNHFPKYLAFGDGNYGWAMLAGIIVVAWLFTKWVYTKGASEAPTLY